MDPGTAIAGLSIAMGQLLVKLYGLDKKMGYAVEAIGSFQTDIQTAISELHAAEKSFQHSELSPKMVPKFQERVHSIKVSLGNFTETIEVIIKEVHDKSFHRLLSSRLSLINGRLPLLQEQMRRIESAITSFRLELGTALSQEIKKEIGHVRSENAILMNDVAATKEDIAAIRATQDEILRRQKGMVAGYEPYYLPTQTTISMPLPPQSSYFDPDEMIEPPPYAPPASHMYSVEEPAEPADYLSFDPYATPISIGPPEPRRHGDKKVPMFQTVVARPTDREKPPKVPAKYDLDFFDAPPKKPKNQYKADSYTVTDDDIFGRLW